MLRKSMFHVDRQTDWRTDRQTEDQMDGQTDGGSDMKKLIVFFFPYNKTNQMHKILKFILEMKLYIFRTVSLSIIRSYSLYTHQWYKSYRFLDNFRVAVGSGWNRVPFWSCCCSKAVYKPVWHIPLLSAQWITPDDGQRNCPKHVEFHFKNKFEKLVHLVGFIIRKFVTMHGHMSRCTVTWT
jgi:hypothetical protein